MDKRVRGPHLIGTGFHSLAGTGFGEYGIDAAFGCHDRFDSWFSSPNSDAMIFSGNLCARINYALDGSGDFIVVGPKTIRQMFQFFKHGVDAAFESWDGSSAYLFKDSEYALIDYSKQALIAIRPIRDGFHCFRGGLFERDIGAAFASHSKEKAYLFKDNKYILLQFTPATTKDYIIGGIKDIVPSNWPSLNGIMPRKNTGFDTQYDYSEQPSHKRDQDKNIA
ncbi:hypothetical protein QOZ80_5BG0432380 [Eleusine coracana subsp. coracana]|nr:hypothetical protein QOZ80_5BG0432380 [Eleusine coracana subsp. coracana]